MRSAPVLGRFRTVPRARRDVRFVWSGDTAGQGWGIDLDWGGMKIFQSAPPAGQVNLPPSAGLQFFGQVDIDCRSKDLVVLLKDVNGDELFRQRLHAK